MKGAFSHPNDLIRFNPNYFLVFALDDDRPIALIGAKKRCLSEPLQSELEVFIDIIEVSQEYQRKGIGTELVQMVIAWAKESNAVQVRAWTEEIRFEALMLWKKMHFSFSQVDFQRDQDKRYGFYVAMRL
jgi:GNAT superfamily N-acetyltransferase